MRIRIFHNNARHEARERGYTPSDTVTEVFAYDRQPDDPHPIDHAWQLLNIGDDPAFGEPDQRAIDYRTRRNRSLNMGDVVAVEHGPDDCPPDTVTFYAVAVEHGPDDCPPDTVTFYAVVGGTWAVIESPTVDNFADHGTTPWTPHRAHRGGVSERPSSENTPTQEEEGSAP